MFINHVSKVHTSQNNMYYGAAKWKNKIRLSKTKNLNIKLPPWYKTNIANIGFLYISVCMREYITYCFCYFRKKQY